MLIPNYEFINPNPPFSLKDDLIPFYDGKLLFKPSLYLNLLQWIFCIKQK